MLLGTPLRVGRHTLRNRVVSPPMERNYGTTDGRTTGRYLAYLRERAAGGAALVFTEATYVRADGRGRRRQLGAHGDHIVPGLRELVQAVHREGALAGVELNHAGRVADPAVTGVPTVAPSAVPFRGRTPRELTTTEAGEVAAAFAAAAVRCAAAGVDVIEVHAAHGYLIHQFLSPRTNHRTDRYADPVRFLTEVLAGIRHAAPDVTLFLRLSAFEGVPGGLDADATLALTRRMPLHLVDALDISAGCYEAGEWIVAPGEVRPGILAPYAARYRDLGKPVAVAGRITTGATAEQILRSGSADLVAVGRAQHADPTWTATVLAGTAPRPCIGCNQGCIDELHRQHPITCLANPRTGREDRPAVARTVACRVLIVGAGLTGLAAARTAALAGHTVTVVETEPQVAGQFRLAARLPGKPEFSRLLHWYTSELGRLGVDLRLSAGPLPPADVVVMAVGGVPRRPPIPGIDLPRVTTIARWVDRPHPAGGVLTVWGVDRAGVAVADAAATAGHRVLLIGAGTELAPEAGPREKGLAVHRLTTRAHVDIRLGATLDAIGESRLLIGRDGDQAWIPVTGPVIVSQGTAPAPHPPVPPGAHVIGLGGAADAAQAIRNGENLTWS
jgi:2,4-dienoyl-CoA reductase-like NADH-dependent reductase (Old Yellow Enzyme family)